MTMPDIPERPGHPSDTRQMVEAERQALLDRARVGGSWSFVIASSMIIVAIILAILLLR
jgi:hypothetical protein